MKKFTVLLLGIFVLALCGCGDKYAINSQENDLIAEYIAGVVLKYNGDGLQKHQEIAKEQNKDEDNDGKGTEKETTPVNKPTEENSKDNGGSGNSGSQDGSQEGTDVLTTLAKELNLSQTKISCTGYKKGDKYPEDGLFSVPATSNNVVFGFEFDIKNNSGFDVVANTASSPVIFKLIIDGQTKVQSSTLLMNDLINLKNVTIKAGETYKAAVVFQIPKANADSTSNMKLQLYSNGELIGNVPLF